MTDKFTQLPGERALRQRGAGESKREHHGRFDAYQSRPVKQSDGKRLRAHDVDENPAHHAADVCADIRAYLPAERPDQAYQQHGEQQRQHIDPPGHGLGGIIVLLDGCIGMLGIILIYQGVGILQEQAEIRHTVGDGGLFLIIELHGQLAGAKIQLILRHLLILKVIDDGAVLHLGLGGIHAENADRHVEEQRDEHYRDDPVSLFG